MGLGNSNPYDQDDAVRILVSKEVLLVGLLVSSIHNVFASLDSPPSSGKSSTREKLITDGRQMLREVLDGPDFTAKGRRYLG